MGEIVHRLSLFTAGERADWIALDGGAILLVLVAWGLAASFALGGVVLAAAASFTRDRARRAQQAVFCFALAIVLGLALPVIFEMMGREVRDGLASWALLWAPALAAAFGLLVRRVGSPR